MKPQNKKEEEAARLFRSEVCLKASDVDESNRLDWFSLSMGFFLALGLSPERAHGLSRWVRYDKQYWAEGGEQP